MTLDLSCAERPMEYFQRNNSLGNLFFSCPASIYMENFESTQEYFPAYLKLIIFWALWGIYPAAPRKRLHSVISPRMSPDVTRKIVNTVLDDKYFFYKAFKISISPFSEPCAMFCWHAKNLAIISHYCFNWSNYMISFLNISRIFLMAIIPMCKETLYYAALDVNYRHGYWHFVMFSSLILGWLNTCG